MARRGDSRPLCSRKHLVRLPLCLRGDVGSIPIEGAPGSVVQRDDGAMASRRCGFDSRRIHHGRVVQREYLRSAPGGREFDPLRVHQSFAPEVIAVRHACLVSTMARFNSELGLHSGIRRYRCSRFERGARGFDTFSLIHLTRAPRMRTMFSGSVTDSTETRGSSLRAEVGHPTRKKRAKKQTPTTTSLTLRSSSLRRPETMGLPGDLATEHQAGGGGGNAAL